jgi:hypothetical protein
MVEIGWIPLAGVAAGLAVAAAVAVAVTAGGGVA